MRTDNRSLVLATLGGLVTAFACTLVTDVDRQKIKPPTGNEGGQGASGGTAGSGGKGGSSGKGGNGGSAGTVQGGEAGEGGVPATGGTGNAGTGNAGSGNAGSGNGGTGNAGTGNAGSGGNAGSDVAGAGGESGAPAQCGNGTVESGEVCDDGNVLPCGTCSADCSAARVIPAGADASLTIGAGTNIADGDTITISDGVNTAVFEFECDPLSDCPGATDGVASGHIPVIFNAMNFDGMNDTIEYRDILIAAIDAADLSTDADDDGSSNPVVSLTGVETLSDVVGAPTFVPAVRCRADRTCSGDSVCLSNSCTAGSCD
jgi:cysteine-rich repeat protein